ncbi:MAG: hypothetical protein AAF317_13815 [Pseudomonadota bacterium]
MRTFNRSAASLAIDLETRRAAALEEVRLASEPFRAAYITKLTGQDMLYVEKRDEAMAYVAEPTPPTDMTEYALLEAEIGVTAPDAYAVAQYYLNLKHIGKQAFAALERPRLAAVLAIEEAATLAEIETALSTFHTELEALS